MEIMSALKWYVLLGAFHELSHMAAASWFGLLDFDDYSGTLGLRWLISIIFERRWQMPIDYSKRSATIEWKLGLVRHSGWIFSLIYALLAYMYVFNYNKKRSIASSPLQNAAVWAAAITAVEAMSTDLLGLEMLALPFFPVSKSESATGCIGNANGACVKMDTFFCGNFGIILLNPAYSATESGRRTALDILEKMISVTMVRGAQSGGVVSFISRSSSHPDQIMGMRSRVVNSKRTDLSKGIRSKIESDALRIKIASKFGGPCEPKAGTLVKTYVGHTRFATSSIASFDGTHPHQWSPPRLWRCYDLSGKDEDNVQTGSIPTLVENFITHNGDFDFYDLNGMSYGLDSVQAWLERVTSYEMPSAVDSAAIAGVVDILHTQGSFALSIRYAVCLGLTTSKIGVEVDLPAHMDYVRLAKFFEVALDQQLEGTGNRLDFISAMPEEREFLEDLVVSLLSLELHDEGAMFSFANFITADEEGGASLVQFVRVVIDAFFDNDLLWTVKTFLQHAKGSFGLCVTSAQSAHRQLCVASRGQTNSIAFFPKSGIICYGSEQAAVKAGMCFPTPGGDLNYNGGHFDERPLRLDLDDLNGEICLIDWGGDENGDGMPEVSPPNRHLPTYKLMNGKINLVLIQEGGTSSGRFLHKRMTMLDPVDHEFMKRLPDDYKDPIAQDIRDIPRICRQIQDDWRGFSNNTSLNRITAWNFTKCLQKRMEKLHSQSIERQSGTIDILLTGCEVSLWLAEQFASDLQKAFPRLRITAISSNKLLGLFGQDMDCPAIGFPISQRSNDMKGTIMIIVSHSGGTFAPLACSNLLQSMSDDIFVVTSEWDVQIGKQLRGMHSSEKDHIVDSRIFTTDVGLRPAEPCSISVAATQQLLTNLFSHISIVILSNPHYRNVSGAIITERDLEELERCNQENIGALEKIVGFDSDGNELLDEMRKTEKELRDMGALWAKHVLENAKSYCWCFIYIFVTVTTGWPIARAISNAIGVDNDNWYYLVGFIDAAIFFWMPQMSILIIRMIEKRNLRHRMVGRTVVVGDVPWVSQSAEAFLGKIFACSYSIAGCGVLSGNPTDHLVHRHTHRVVRGSLLLCGRPDGRLSALTSLETSVCLSINQASSIQSIGGTCESVTIGHNPFQLPLSKKAIFLDRARPMYLCERMLGEMDHKSLVDRRRTKTIGVNPAKKKTSAKGKQTIKAEELDDKKQFDSDSRSAAALQGAYHNLSKEANKGQSNRHVSVAVEAREHDPLEVILEEAISERQRATNMRSVFNDMDEDGNGKINADQFIAKYYLVDSTLSKGQVLKIFMEADHDGAGYIDYEKFLRIAEMPAIQMLRALQTINRPRSLLQVEASSELYFGEQLRRDVKGIGLLSIEQSQHFSMELYEGRIASMQRFVAMTVMFHEMGKKVENFFSKYTFGILGYRYDRTHSIMRIATTASPVSGADVRDRSRHLKLSTKIKRSLEVVSFAWLRYRQRQQEEAIRRSGYSKASRSIGHSARQIAPVGSARSTRRVQEASNTSVEIVEHLQ
mmetsp:Transcript_2825/g.6181  ORF Transcript_2825/g.6181 Transcript_2825/m.6181 type:complete len:1521 (-) Transcript_2825:409-4971(-)